MKIILFIFGTRPEAIKVAPLIKEFQKYTTKFDVRVCLTGQHREMLDQVINFFELTPDYDLNLMQANQTLFDITARGIKALQGVLDDCKPDLVFVQGDTTSAFIGALASFYKRISVAHLEAGLRSGNKYSPFPEEINRVLAGHIANFHFAPTEQSKRHLANEGITENVWVVGNTVIDALFLGLDIIKRTGEDKYRKYFEKIDFSKKIILVTVHRRESFGEPFIDICQALRQIAEENPDAEIVYPVHLNPNISEPAKRILGEVKGIHLLAPLDYPYLIWLMNEAYIIVTDSGGIQEEGPSLGKPVLVLREVTERMEGVEAGTAKLLGSNQALIVKEVSTLLNDSSAYQEMAKAINPYGDGQTSKKIVEILR
jgi:UDP-N-acetylglucosamine 2-epimerase (non-hydrolysing)